MSNVRFTNDILSRQTLFDLGNITDTLAKTQNELSTGKQHPAARGRPVRRRPGASRCATSSPTSSSTRRTSTTASRWRRRPTRRSATSRTSCSARASWSCRPRNGTHDQSSLNAISAEIDADQGVAARAGERDVRRPLHLLGHGDERSQPYPVPERLRRATTLPVQRLIGHGQVDPGEPGRAVGVRRPSAGPPARRTCSTCSTTIIERPQHAGTTPRSARARPDRARRVVRPTAVNARTTVGAISESPRDAAARG